MGGLLPFAAFITVVFWWLKCQHLWSADQRLLVGEVLMDNLPLCQADQAWLG